MALFIDLTKKSLQFKITIMLKDTARVSNKHTFTKTGKFSNKFRFNSVPVTEVVRSPPVLPYTSSAFLPQLLNTGRLRECCRSSQ